jgi:arylsulfatase
MWITVVSCGEKGNEISVKPNIVFILADDLGHGEVGYQGQKKINTSLIDALARSGKIFTNHYTAALNARRLGSSR